MFCLYSKAQIVNYVNNGGVESINTCTSSLSSKANYWTGIDTTKVDYLVLNSCIGNVPYNGSEFQFPRSGNGFLLGTFLCDVNFCNPVVNRNYLRNRLKSSLTLNSVYCVKFYVNIKNSSPSGIDGFGALFSGNDLDTIKYCNVPITYYSPQVKNPSGNIIIDTSNWQLVTGTFTATGIEKYLVIGNFKSDANTQISQIQPTVAFAAGSDVCVDDVSVIDIDLPAFAGRDTFFIPGDSIYLGRPSDVGIDEDCMWYKLPNTTTAIDTVAGLWVKPVTTTTYVVKQDICGVIKWDTVVLYQSAIGVHELDLINNNLKIYPQPAANEVVLELNLQLSNPIRECKIYNSFGQLLREEEINFKSGKAKLLIEDLANGVYFISISNQNHESITKKLFVAK